MRFAVALIATLVIAPAGRAAFGAPNGIEPRNLSGTWTLNTWLSDPSDQIERELFADLGPRNQFDVAPDAPDQPHPATRDAMGRRRGMDPGAASPKALLNADDNKRIRALIDTVRQPAVTLTISQTNDGVTIADPVRGTRSFVANGSKQKQLFDSATLESSTRWEGPQLLTDYQVRRGVSLRFSYMLVPDGDHLLVRISVLTPDGEVAPYVIRHVYSRTPG